MTNEEVRREYLSRRSGPLYHLTSGHNIFLYVIHGIGHSFANKLNFSKLIDIFIYVIVYLY